MEKTANVYKSIHYPTKLRGKIRVKGLTLPQKVYTIAEPDRTASLSPIKLPQPLPATGGINSFDNVVMKIIKSPSTKLKVKEATDCENNESSTQS